MKAPYSIKCLAPLYLCLSSCSSSDAWTPKPAEKAEAMRSGVKSMNSGFMLSDSQLGNLRNLGLEGDKDAAFRVYNHFDLAMGDYDQAEKWLILAARLGHPAAKRTVELRAKFE